MKEIAILGLPNVGKSSLFNRLAKERIAITSDVAGTTRDVKRAVIAINDKDAVLVDTGGIDEGSELLQNVKDKALEAAGKADLLLYVVDGKSLPDEADRQLFYRLQALGTPLALVINKVDNDRIEQQAWEFASFGAKTVIPVSVSHGRHMGKLIGWIDRHLDAPAMPVPQEEPPSLEALVETMNLETGERDDSDQPIGVAIIGRTNVGKSSLLNAILGNERAVVSDIAGTTIDPIDEVVMIEERPVTLIDTAGIRRRGKIEGIEHYALQRTRQMLERADIALLVLDAGEPFRDLDEKIAGLIDQYRLGCIIVLNKWDRAIGDFKELSEAVRDRFKFLSYAPIVTVSAKSHKRVHKINDLILKIYDNFAKHIPTSMLNETIRQATFRHHIPSHKGKPVRILFATQYGIRPPKIALVSNRPEGIHFSYIRYLSNQLRENFDLEGTPLLLTPRRRGEREEEEER